LTELSNHKLSILNFQDSLKQIKLKTIHNDQVATVDYCELFADQRAIVLSLPSLYLRESYSHVRQYKSEHEAFINNKIDKVYVINSYHPLISNYVDSMFKPMLGLSDKNQEFVSALATEVKSTKHIDFLSRRWEYVAIINNGNLEKFWQNPIPESISLRHYRYGHRDAQWEQSGKVQDIGTLHYRKLGPATVLDYLKNSVDNSN